MFNGLAANPPVMLAIVVAATALAAGKIKIKKTAQQYNNRYNLVFKTK
ncbi:hypothetical protein MuYL_0551 [Mucilaginibacter xinganensis]|uniref:Uncharacterized protein n=1 Tax=Mucilaginibacter xinganensis TaxID=1234841 RepID=A0A223NRZ0_9SPHI|nr:hypothetical protein MuYL_0551 [Mucilaginibacter xinganensis]